MKELEDLVFCLPDVTYDEQEHNAVILGKVLILPFEEYIECMSSDILKQFLDSYLLHSEKLDCESLSRRVFFLYFRLVSGEHKISDEDYGKVLYDNWIVDIPKLLDICRIFSSNPTEIRAFCSGIFKLQPSYFDDFYEAVALFTKSISDLKKVIEGNKGVMGELLAATDDIVTMMLSFVAAFPTAAQLFIGPYCHDPEEAGDEPFACEFLKLYDVAIARFLVWTEITPEKFIAVRELRVKMLLFARILIHAVFLVPSGICGPQLCSLPAINELCQMGSTPRQTLYEGLRNLFNHLIYTSNAIGEEISQLDDKDKSRLFLLAELEHHFSFSNLLSSAAKTHSADDLKHTASSLLVFVDTAAEWLSEEGRTFLKPNVAIPEAPIEKSSSLKRDLDAELRRNAKQMSDMLSDYGIGFLCACLQGPSANEHVDKDALAMTLLSGSLPKMAPGLSSLDRNASYEDFIMLRDSVRESRGLTNAFDKSAKKITMEMSKDERKRTTEMAKRIAEEDALREEAEELAREQQALLYADERDDSMDGQYGLPAVDQTLDSLRAQMAATTLSGGVSDQGDMFDYVRDAEGNIRELLKPNLNRQMPMPQRTQRKRRKGRGGGSDNNNNNNNNTPTNSASSGPQKQPQKVKQQPQKAKQQPQKKKQSDKPKQQQQQQGKKSTKQENKPKEAKKDQSKGGASKASPSSSSGGGDKPNPLSKKQARRKQQNKAKTGNHSRKAGYAKKMAKGGL